MCFTLFSPKPESLTNQFVGPLQQIKLPQRDGISISNTFQLGFTLSVLWYLLVFKNWQICAQIALFLPLQSNNKSLLQLSMVSVLTNDEKRSPFPFFYIWTNSSTQNNFMKKWTQAVVKALADLKEPRQLKKNEMSIRYVLLFVI